MDSRDASTSVTGTKRRFPRLLRWTAELGGLFAIYLAVSAWQQRNMLPTASMAPTFSLGSLDGRTVELSEFHGKRVALHFWATWCGVCRREFGALNAVHDELAEDEVLLSIVEDAEDPALVADFVRDHSIRYPVLLGSDAVLRNFRIDAFPTNYFLDKTGRIQDRTVGISTRWGLATRLDRATP